MKVILDANVFISAFASRGLCDQILEFCFERQKIILSSPLMGEIRAGFHEKLKMPKSEIEDNLDFILRGSEVRNPQKVPRNSCRDPNDLHVLGLAVAVGADYIITGDEDLLELKSFHGTQILSPRNFWENMKRPVKPKKS